MPDGSVIESNILVREMETRPDWRVPGPGGYVHILRDLWPQVNGSADTWPQWARDDYLKQWGDPCSNDSAGGETHLFAVVTGVEEQCGVLHNKLFIAWTDGFAKLGDPNYNGYVQARSGAPHGWVNWFDSNRYFPDQGQRGPWCWCPVGAADVVDGGGLPYNRHVSWFAVWERVTYADYLTENGDGGGQTNPQPPSGAASEYDYAQALAMSMSTLVVRQDAVGGSVVYSYMPEDEVVARAIAIAQGLSDHYAASS